MRRYSIASLICSWRSISAWAGVAAGFGNVGYMGPGLALGPEAAVPVALVFCFDALVDFLH